MSVHVNDVFFVHSRLLRPKEYYKTAIMQGRILVSDEKVDLNYKIKDGDVLTHTVHRHEPAVAVSSPDGIIVLQETEDLIVVDKPGTLPVHPCGGYHMNSLSHVLEERYGKLYNINRLDRLTSGLVLLAKTPAVAQQLGKCIMQRDSCQKVYLARVKGKFPLNCPIALSEQEGNNLQLVCSNGEWLRGKVVAAAGGSRNVKTKTKEEMQKDNALGAWITDSNGIVAKTASLQNLFDSQHSVESLLDDLETAETQENASIPHKEPLWLQLACPTRVSKPKDGICEAGSFEELEPSVYEKTVKPAQTSFSVVNYDARTDSSLVICRPMTGRTHQIRLHLQFLGHPIVNDPNYGGEMFVDAKAQEVFEKARMKLNALNHANNALENTLDASVNKMVNLSLPATCSDTPASQAELDALSHLKRSDNESLSNFIRRTCVWCSRSRGEESENARTTLEFLCRSSGIFLHAFSYILVDDTGKRYQFRTNLPSWAS